MSKEQQETKKSSKNEDKNYTIIDGTDLIMGRMGSQIAKRLLRGENIKIVNCKDVVLLGKKSYLVEKYREKLKNKVVKQGPYYSRSPGEIVRRGMRNMLPYKSKRGIDAFKRLKCYNSVPSVLLNEDKSTIDSAKVNYDTVFYYTRVGEISNQIGYNKRG